MKNLIRKSVMLLGALCACAVSYAQYRTDAVPQAQKDTQVVRPLEQALEIALSENVSVKVADMEIERTGYAKKGA